MKYLFLLLALVSFSVPVHAQMEEEPNAVSVEYIHGYTVRAEVRPDGFVHVDEVIDYDFGEEERHGIFRDIPRARVAGGVGPIDITDVVVTDEAGVPYETDVTHGSDEVSIRIGDPDVTITGRHTYRIQYVAQYAIGYFDDRDELYWNAIGTSWQVPIAAATTTVVIPGKIDQSVLSIATYCGPFGETNVCSDPVVTHDTAANTTEVRITKEALEPYEGITMAVGFPHGIVPPLTWQDKAAAYLKAYGPFLIVAAVFVAFMLFVSVMVLRQILSGLASAPGLIVTGTRKLYEGIVSDLRAWRYDSTHPVVTEFDAGTFTPLEAGVITATVAQNKFLSAELIWLAVHGYLRIEYNTGDYRFVRTDKDASSLGSYQKHLLDGVAGKTKSELVNEFYTTARLARKAVGQSLHGEGYIIGSTEEAFGSIPAGIVIGTFIWIALLFWLGIHFWENWMSFAVLVVGVLFVVIANVARLGGVLLTDSGLEARHKLRGLRRYIAMAEAERIKFHNAPEKTPETFEKLLPYAMVFGLEKEWAAQFADIHTAPEWYTGDPSLRSFSTGAFVSSLGSFSSQTTAALTSMPASSGSSGSYSGSSGGGSSGGGGGGGGGSSW